MIYESQTPHAFRGIIKCICICILRIKICDERIDDVPEVIHQMADDGNNKEDFSANSAGKIHHDEGGQSGRCCKYKHYKDKGIEEYL